MIRAGDLNRRVTLESYTDPAGGDPTAGTYTTQATVWAERLDARGMERTVGGQYAAEVTQAYRIRHRADVTPKWRVLDGTERWDVQAVLPDRGHNRGLVLLVRRLDPDEG